MLEKINGGWSVEEITEGCDRAIFKEGFSSFFPAEENSRLWKLLIQRTLEHFGIEMERGDKCNAKCQSPKEFGHSCESRIQVLNGSLPRRENLIPASAMTDLVEI